MAQKKYVALSNLPVVFTAVKNYVDGQIGDIPEYTLPAASATVLGGVKVGANVNVTADGTISVAAPVTKVSELTNDSSFVTSTQMQTAISTAKSEIIGGAPETYDTLKEIADYIATHASVETALNAAIGNKADKSYVDTTFVKEADLVAATEAEITAAATGVFDAA